jgi:hypothetical protein
MSNKVRLLVIGLIGLLVLAGCTDPPEPLGSDAKGLSAKIGEVRKDLNTAKKNYGVKLKDKKYDFIRSYSKQDRRVTLFGDAERKLKDADKVVNNTINPLLENYDEGKQKQLQAAVTEATRFKDEAARLLKLPSEWADILVYARDHRKDVVAHAKTQSESLTADHTALTGKVNESKTAFPKQSSELDRRFQPFPNLQVGATEAFNRLQAENAKATPNYAVLTANAELIDNNRKTFTANAATLTSDVDQLSVSETRTLLDTTVETFIIVERTSWYEGEAEDPPEHDYDYAPRKVDVETASHFAAFATPGTVLATDEGEFRTVNGVDMAHWDKLKIDSLEKMGENGQDPYKDDNWSEFSMGEFDQTICNKIYVIKNGRADSSGRPDPSKNSCHTRDNPSEVAQGTYWVESDEFRGSDVGMDIYAKSAGDFTSQATTAASPPGIAYVGDTSMGYWQNNDTVWFFAAGLLYGDLFRGGSYHRSEYDRWHSGYRYHNKPYYGKDEKKRTYGGGSSYVPLILSSNNNFYDKRSGLRNATVRGAGVSARGGGPGGGGK